MGHGFAVSGFDAATGFLPGYEFVSWDYGIQEYAIACKDESGELKTYARRAGKYLLTGRI
jgi:hypothetical protein